MIKKTTLVILTSIASLCTWAQSPSNINGITHAPGLKKVGLYKVLNGRLSEIATSSVDEKGRFAFRFTPEYEGLYALGSGNPQSQQGLYRFYFKGNEDLNLSLDQDGYELTGKNSSENETLYHWDIASKNMHDKALTLGSTSTYVDFFPEVEEFNSKLTDIKKNVKTGNAKFDKFFPEIVDNDFAYYAMTYLYMPRSAHASKEEMSDYYVQFKPDRFLTTELLKFPYGDRFLNNLVFYKVDLAKRPSFDEQVTAIGPNVLKAQYILPRLEGSRSYAGFQEMNDRYKQYFTLPEQIERAKAVEARLVETKTGVPAFQFSFPDITDKKVSLADLKGNVVLIDMWATWCGPCRAEEPHWEKLNEEFKGKPVSFVGVSIDKDKPKWDAYVKDKKLKGIQLHAGVENELVNAYIVDGIPRYILIDKSGNLISADSPRPSDPKLKALLEEWVKK
ncbi:MAG: TlpA family protein disulfide reductase [Sphingobacterium sp.]|jgi:thiol-disulfide isomerase/thioredoxin|uniref:TlpA family protein disulfide reductase n=1 Tax=Sphingobacterium sp. TaxID=341027 RepID=UPI00283B66DB|nr:TlpA disulfide reductase family protein [Sphingobacterium sp.]MDR3006572.1 TlpA family protein disulfide reductase [Sphingobacterium sp.]